MKNLVLAFVLLMMSEAGFAQKNFSTSNAVVQIYRSRRYRY